MDQDLPLLPPARFTPAASVVPRPDRLVRRALASALTDRGGAVALEFVLVAPILITILFAIIGFGITLNNYVELAGGVSAGSRILSISRGSATPYSATSSAVTGAAANLDATTLKSNLVVTVNGNACTTDAACQTLLNSATGTTAIVRTSYPCTLGLVSLQTACTLVSQSAQAVE